MKYATFREVPAPPPLPIGSSSVSKKIEPCKHNWIFQEKYKKTIFSGDEPITANYKRIDRYYCSNCCEINEIEKSESVSLPWGIRHSEREPIWY